MQVEGRADPSFGREDGNEGPRVPAERRRAEVRDVSGKDEVAALRPGQRQTNGLAQLLKVPADGKDETLGKLLAQRLVGEGLREGEQHALGCDVIVQIGDA